MPTFEIQQDGHTYQVTADDENAAMAALNGATGQKASSPEDPGFLYDMAKGLQNVGNKALGLFPNVAADALDLAHTLGLTDKTGANAPTLASVETALGAPPRPDLAENTLPGKIGTSAGENILGTLAGAGVGMAAKPLEMAATEGVPLIQKGVNMAGNVIRQGLNAVREGGAVVARHPGVGLMTDLGAAGGQNVGAPAGQDVGERIGNAVAGDEGAKVGGTVGATLGGYAGALLGAVPGMASVALSRPGGIGIPRLGGKDFGTGAPGEANSASATALNVTGSKNTQDLIDKFDKIRVQTETSIQDAVQKMQSAGDVMTKEQAAENLRDTLANKIYPQVQAQEQAAYSKIENLPVDAKPILKDFKSVFNPRKDLAGKPATSHELRAVHSFLAQLTNYAKKPNVTIKDFIGRYGLSTTARSRQQHILSTDQSSGILEQLRGKIIAGIKAQYPDNEDVDNALNITTWKNQTFKEGPIGKFLQMNKPDAERAPAGDLSTVLMRHPKVGQTVNDISMRMNSPEVKQDMHSLIASAHDEIAAARGPEAAQKWYNSRDTQQLIKDFPEMKARMDMGSADLGRALAAREEFNKNAFLSKYQEDPDLAAQALLKSKNSAVEVPQVLKRLSGDPKGLQTFREHVIKNFLKLHNVKDANNLQAALADMGTERTRRTLGSILGSKQYGDLQSILIAMNKLKLGQEGIISSAGRKVAGVAGKIIGARLGPRHLGSGSLIIAGIRAKAGQRIAESIFKNIDPDAIIARAAEDPNYRKFILSKVPETKQDVQFAYKQLRRLTALEDAGLSGYAAENENGGSLGGAIKGSLAYIGNSIVSPAQ